MAVNERHRGGGNGGAERDPGLDRLYREAAGEAPPAHLDAAILAAARREVGARPRALAPALRRWYVPVSIAAVVVVSVSLVMLVREEGGVQMREAQVPEAAMRRIEPAAAPPTQPTLAEAESSRVQPQAAAPERLRRQESRDDARYPAAEERAAPAKADTVTPGRMAAAPTAPSELLAAPSAADAPQARLGVRGMSAQPAEQDRLPVWRAFEKEPPEKWLAQVEELRRQGRTADAEEMLSEFKRRFPQHPLPLSSK